MRLPLKRLISIGGIVLVISILFMTNGMKFSGGSSVSSFNHTSEKTWLTKLVPLPAGVAFAQGQAQAAARPQMSEEAFKNIQVLKGIPVDEFMGTMGLFSAALSVCCGDCHQGAGGFDPKWEADPPKKVTARKMIQMVNTINKDNFGGVKVVTCWTCHRGSEAPSVTPAMDMIYGEPTIYPRDILPPASGANVATVDAVFTKYIQALGGAQRLAALTSWTAKGMSTLYGETDMVPAELYAKAPNQFATIVHQKDGDLARVFDGRNGWVMQPQTVLGLYQLNASLLDGGKFDAQLAFPAGIRQSFNNWRSSFPATLDGRDAYVVQGNNPGGLVVTLFFDKQTGLLTRMIRYANTALGRVPTQIDYSDYRRVAGVMMPHKFTYGWISGREEYVLSEIQPNVAIDAAKFAKPVQRK
jgi:photosynthetic reaction center cytochrome c subunit